MKKIFFRNNSFLLKTKLLLPFLFFSLFANAQNGAWTQKANFGGAAINEAIGFSIGTKGYIGVGDTAGTPSAYPFYQGFWEWDQATNVWTQKANFPGTSRLRATAFSIGTKGYVGTGKTCPANCYTNDFWEWDQASNIWTQKANFGGVARQYATSFSVGTKGYIGTGSAGNTKYQDFWEYDPSANTWTQKANFGGTARHQAVGFSIGAKGYIGMGYDTAYEQDFWEWDQATNTWTQKANFGGVARWAPGFSIGTKGYVGTGYSNIYIFLSDFWEYDQSTDTWTQKANYCGPAGLGAVGFSIGTKGYIGTGQEGGKTFWEFDPNGCTVYIGGNTSICNGDNTTLTASGGSNYSWNTGQTTTSIIVSPTTNTTYTVTATTGTCVATASITVNVSQPQIASITGNTTLCSGNVTTLTASGGLNYSWSTGQTKTSIGVSLTATASYTVTATTGACIAIATTTVTVNSKPVTAFNAPNVCLNNATTFTDLSTGNNTITNWAWNFGDGNTSTQQNPSHTYSSYGTYFVTLVVSNNFGCQDSIQQTVVVNPLPIANFVSDTACYGDSTCFTDLSFVPSGMIVNWAWNFGDPTSGGSNISSLQYPCHKFTSAGNFNSIMTATSDSACQSTVMMAVTVQTCTGIFELKNNDGIIISPNPFSCETQIQVSGGQLSVIGSQFILYDVFGREVYRSPFTDNRLLLKRGNLPSGIYFYKVSSESKVLGTGKIIAE